MGNKQKIIYMLLISLGFYIGYSIWGNINKIEQILQEIKWEYYFLFMFIVLFGYVIRFYRWHYLLKAEEIKISISKSIRIFLSGMSMAISPGKLGEILKTFYLNKECNVEYSKSLPVVFLERFADLLAIILLMSVGLFELPFGVYPFCFSVIVVLLIVIGMKNRSFVYFVFKLIEKRLNEDKMNKMKDVYEQSLKLLTLKTIAISTFLSICAWFCECNVLFLIFKVLNIHISLLNSVVVFSFGTLLGAVSMIPGGMGVTEGSMTSVMILLGIGKSTSIGITILIRLLTLWFGTIVGFVFLASFKAKK